MIIALPLTEENTFSSHFGASARAALFDVDSDRREIACSGVFTPPGISPCGWGPWLRDLGVQRFLACGMGYGAQQGMLASGIEVVTGVAPGDLESIVRSWLDGTLAVGANACSGGHGDGHDGCHHHHGEDDHGDGHDDHHHGRCHCGE